MRASRPIVPGSKAHRRHGCERKRRYPDQITALAFAIHQVERGAPRLLTYRCRFCRGWHLAKARSKGRRGTPT